MTDENLRRQSSEAGYRSRSNHERTETGGWDSGTWDHAEAITGAKTVLQFRNMYKMITVPWSKSNRIPGVTQT